jgi:hypothetical protein
MSEISKEKIKQALDKFEEDDFVSSKDILARELKKKINKYIKDKIHVEKDPIDVPKDTDDKTEPTDDKTVEPTDDKAVEPTDDKTE